MIAAPNRLMRDAIPALATGVRSREAVLKLKFAPLAPVQASPASTKGVISIGGNEDWIRPKPDCPTSGMRISTLATAMRLPSSRSNSGHVLDASAPVPLAEQ